VNAIALRHLRDPQRQFAKLRAWGSAGWIAPSLPVFAWLVIRGNGQLDFIIGLTLAAAFGMVVTAFYLPHTPPGAARHLTPSIGYWKALRKLLGNTTYRVVIVSYLLVSASFAVQAFYSPPRLEDLGMPRPWIGMVQSAGVLWEIVLFMGRGAIVTRLGYGGSILIGCLVLLVRQLVFVWVDNLWVLAASYLLVGTTIVLYHIGVSLVVEAVAGPEVKSTAQTVLTLCSSGLGPILANAGVAQLMAGPGAELTEVFLFSAGLTALACVLLGFGVSRLGQIPQAPGTVGQGMDR
jgi:hypothetical protein